MTSPFVTYAPNNQLLEICCHHIVAKHDRLSLAPITLDARGYAAARGKYFGFFANIEKCDAENVSPPCGLYF